MGSEENRDGGPDSHGGELNGSGGGRESRGDSGLHNYPPSTPSNNSNPQNGREQSKKDHNEAGGSSTVPHSEYSSSTKPQRPSFHEPPDQSKNVEFPRLTNSAETASDPPADVIAQQMRCEDCEAHNIARKECKERKCKAAEEAKEADDYSQVSSDAENEPPSKKARPSADTEPNKEPVHQGMMLINIDLVPVELRDQVAQRWCRPLPEYMVKGESQPEVGSATPQVLTVPEEPTQQTGVKRKLMIPITFYHDKVEVGTTLELDSDDETASNKKRIRSYKERSLYQSCYAQPAQPAQSYGISQCYLKPESETAYASNNPSQSIKDRPRRVPSSRLRKPGTSRSSESEASTSTYEQSQTVKQQARPFSSSRAATPTESYEDDIDDPIVPVKPSQSHLVGNFKRKSEVPHSGFRNYAIEEFDVYEDNSTAYTPTMNARTIITPSPPSKSSKNTKPSAASELDDSLPRSNPHSSAGLLSPFQPDWNSGCKKGPLKEVFLTSVEEVEEKMNRASYAAAFQAAQARPKATPTGRFKLGFSKSPPDWNGPKHADSE